MIGIYECSPPPLRNLDFAASSELRVHDILGEPSSSDQEYVEALFLRDARVRLLSALADRRVTASCPDDIAHIRYPVLPNAAKRPRTDNSEHTRIGYDHA